VSAIHYLKNSKSEISDEMSNLELYSGVFHIETLDFLGAIKLGCLWDILVQLWINEILGKLFWLRHKS
jgi:hypothetical protein